jgi:hypothetical protein
MVDGCSPRDNKHVAADAFVRCRASIQFYAEPNTVTAVVHDRMPVILDLDSYDLWLDPGIKDVGLVPNC